MQEFKVLYGTIWTQERVLVRHGIQAISVRAIEVLLYNVHEKPTTSSRHNRVPHLALNVK